jgi:hypothetical protein
MRVTATKIYNPIFASGITAFIRSLIWDCLHNNHKLGGPKGVVSVTTDRFITNIGDLENKLLTLPSNEILLLSK